MTSFLIAFFSAVLPLAYYFCLLFGKALLPEHVIMYGVIPIFILLHIALRRIISESHVHVFTLFAVTALFTFYKTFSNGTPFLYVLAGLHGVILIAVCLTYPMEENKSTSSMDENSAEKSDIKQ